MDVSVRSHDCVGLRARVHLRLSHLQGCHTQDGGEVAYPDFLTHYHITSVCHPFFPLTFLSPARALSQPAIV